MKKIVLAGAAAAALFAGPAMAQQPRDGAAPRAEVTRADVEARVRGSFARADANRDGYVTEAEASAFRQSFRAQRQERRSDRREAAFARLDANRDGAISRDEFLSRGNRAERSAGRGFRAERRADRLERRAERREHRLDRRGGRGFGMGMFARLDADRDGRVSLAEATSARLRAFDRADVNRDGRITREERRSFRDQRRERRG